MSADLVMVDTGAARSACPSDYANEHEVRGVQHKIQFQTASGELLEHHGGKLVPYMTQDTIMGRSGCGGVLHERRRHDGSVFHHKEHGFAMKHH